MRFLRPSTIIGGILVAISATIIHAGMRWQAQFRAVEAAETVRLPVDLSRPGEYISVFHQVYQFGHDQGLELHVSPELASPDELYDCASAALKSAEGEVLITNASGATVFRGPLEFLDAAGWRCKLGSIPIAGFSPFKPGDYTLSIRVDKPAVGLAGRSQYVVGKHWLCGCEGLMLANFAFMIGGALLIPGAVCLIVGAAAGFRSWRASRRAESLQPSATP